MAKTAEVSMATFADDVQLREEVMKLATAAGRSSGEERGFCYCYWGRFDG